MRTFGNLLAFSPELWLLAGAIVVFVMARFMPRASTTPVALVGLVPLARVRHAALGAVPWLFLVGSVLFSGSLYALALTGVRLWGAVTPLGGIAFIAGWLVLAWGLWRGRVTA